MEFKNPIATADMIVENEKGEMLFVKRKHSPYQGYWVFPGGCLECDQETLEETAVRELFEETGLIAETQNIELLGVYSDPKRDPRGHVITHAYIIKIYKGQVKADDDAEDAQWFSKESKPPLGFDHEQIFIDYLAWKEKNGK
jgi:ADP-ribose pyrophosphatase YjhB (NUDIX family)